MQADAATDEVYARLALVAEGEVNICSKLPDWIRVLTGIRGDHVPHAPWIGFLGCQMCQSLFHFQFSVWWSIRNVCVCHFWLWLLRLIWEEARSME